MLDQVPGIAFGWLLGLLSPIIVDAIKTKRESSAVTAAIKGELNEVSYRMTLASYNVAMHLGAVDKVFLTWVRDCLVLYHGKEHKDKIAESIAVKLSWTDQELTNYTEGQAATGTQALVLVKFSAPFVDARVAALHQIETVIQLELNAVRADLALLDDLVEQSRTYFHLTFGKLENSNYPVVRQNLRGVYEQYMKRCRISADRMNQLQLVL